MEDDFGDFSSAFPPPSSSLPPLNVGQPTGTDTDFGESLFHEAGGNVFEIPPLPDDIFFSPQSPDNESAPPPIPNGIHHMSAGAIKSDPATNLSPPPLTDSPTPLNDSDQSNFLPDFPKFSPEALPPLDFSLSEPPPLSSFSEDDFSSNPSQPPPLLTETDPITVSGEVSSWSGAPGPILSTAGTNAITPSDEWNWSGAGDDSAAVSGEHGSNLELERVQSPDPFSEFASFSVAGTVETGTTSSSSITVTSQLQHSDMPSSVSNLESDKSPQLKKTSATIAPLNIGEDNGYSQDNQFAEFSSTDWVTTSAALPSPPSPPAIDPSSSSSASLQDFGPPSQSEKSRPVAASAENTATIDTEFGAFESTPTQPVDNGTKTEPQWAEFGGFENTENTVAQSNDGEQQWAEFGGFNEAPNTDTSASNSSTMQVSSEFGEFSGTGGGGEDDFGDFGSFASSSLPAPTAKNETSTPKTGPSTAQEVPLSSDKLPKEILFTCFPTVTMDTIVGVTNNAAKQLAHCLNDRVWPLLISEAVSTSSLYQWQQSLLQDHYYSSLKIDTMVVPVIKTASQSTSVLAGQLESGLLSPGTRLLDGFGFEPRTKREFVDLQLKEEPQDAVFGWDSSSEGTGATLLDLSLPPSSPTNQTEQGFAMDADLMGLDLTTAPPPPPAVSTTATLQSTNSTWIDSQLLELGVGERDNNSHEPRPITSTSDVTEQLVLLGLDTSKTTWKQQATDNTTNTTLSEAAKVVINRLPDLSFMLTELSLDHIK